MAWPYWASVNLFISQVIFAWIVTPLMWRGKAFDAPDGMALNGTAIYSSKGKKLNARALVDPDTHRIIDAKYEGAFSSSSGLHLGQLFPLTQTPPIELIFISRAPDFHVSVLRHVVLVLDGHVHCRPVAVLLLVR